MKIIFDIETDSLNATKIHIFSYTIYETQTIPEIPKVYSITDYDEMRKLLLNPTITTLIGHNIVRYDIPILKRILGIEINKALVDTLGLSWYLYPERNKHGLESWGNDLGTKKVEINDWLNLSIEEYQKRCETDVIITNMLFQQQLDYLREIYGVQGFTRIVNYITFKLDCAREQEETKILLDKKLCTKTLNTLLPLQERKMKALTNIMPDEVKYKTVEKPSKMIKKNGNLTESGKKWLELLKEKGLPPDFSASISVEDKVNEAKPNSPTQLKNYLFSLGWKPRTFKYVPTKTKGVSKIPQIVVGEDICESVKELYIKQPILKELESLTIITHRINILKGFLRDCDENGYITARVKGLTNTLRFQHTEIVNLPSVHKPYGKEIRGCLTCKENELLCGSDMTNIEDKTKRHFIYFFDPEYVKEMDSPDFDAHLDIALLANMLTKEQVQAHKNKTEDYSKIRKDAKQVNFACTYGSGIPKIVLTSGIPVETATILHQTFWKRNWAIKKIANSLKVKTVNGQMWLLNPVSQFWYSLRNEKDKFSTLNQGTATYCFDNYVREMRKRGARMCGQFHDEYLTRIKSGTEQKVKKLAQESIQEVNNQLKLNVELGISIDFGKDYSCVH